MEHVCVCVFAYVCVCVCVCVSCRRPVVVRQLVDDVLCAALHPSGTMLLLGLHDRLVLYSIALVSVRQGHEKCERAAHRSVRGQHTERVIRMTGSCATLLHWWV